MRSIRNQVLLGTFVIIGAGLFILAVLTVGSRQRTFDRTQRVRILFDDAEGLQAGDNVWLSGVKVGTVKSVSLTIDNQVEVQLNIGRKDFSHLYRDASGKIGSDGLIGNRIIILHGGRPDSGRVIAGGTITSEKTVRTEDMLATLQENNRNLLAITGELKVIAGKINNGQGTIGLLLNDAGMAGKLRQAVAGLQTASDRTALLTERLNVFAGELNSNGLAHQLVTDTVVFRRLQETMDALKAAGDQIAAAAGNIRETAGNIRDASGGLKSPGTPAGMLLHDSAVAADLRATAGHLRTSSQKLDEDLLALQHNFLLRGFFRKKEKAARDSAASRKLPY